MNMSLNDINGTISTKRNWLLLFFFSFKELFSIEVLVAIMESEWTSGQKA